MEGARVREGGFDRPKNSDQIGAGAPQPLKCRATAMVSGHPTARCLAKSGVHCRFASWFGAETICNHPGRERIIARTLAREGQHR